jgi:bifunctional DNase/RNase
MEKVRLRFAHVSEIVGNNDLAVLALTDMESEWQLTIVCDRAMAVQLELRAKSVPISDIMLPEVVGRLLTQWGGLDLEILIYNLYDGQYQTAVVNKQTQDMMPIRASDGVLLHVATGMPLFVEKSLMARQSVRYSAKAQGVAIPVNTLNSEMLETALQKAINEENYELASQIRDEKLRRSASKKQPE